MKAVVWIGLCTVLACTGCDNSERIARLEKQNQQLQEEIANQKASVTNFELQAKCSKDAEAWFNEHWSRDKDTILLDFKNHYDKSAGKCFIVVEFHYYPKFFDAGSWINDMELTDVYENARYGNFAEVHEVILKPQYHWDERVQECMVYGTKCKSLEEFSSLTRHYMND